MAKKLKIGVIGMSEGNGHPFSWSAIFNGYNPKETHRCSFSTIIDYLSAHKFPQDGLSTLGQVTHVWTQDRNCSEDIARFSNIPYVVNSLEDMTSEVDIVLLARDDAENHFVMSSPFLKAGIPIFIDKPLAFTLAEAHKIWDGQLNEDQVFSCSALRFSEELYLTDNEKIQAGQINYAEAITMKDWSKYAIHLLEPILIQIPDRGNLLNVSKDTIGEIQITIIRWEYFTLLFRSMGKIPSPFVITYYGDRQMFTKKFNDSFSCFKSSLDYFIGVVTKRRRNIPKKETEEIIKIIELGNA